VKTLEDLEPGMDAQCMSILGDSITYRRASGSTLSLKAYVNFEEMARSIDIGKAIEQAMTVEVQISDLPQRPAPTDRITLAKVAGRTFQPINVSRDRSGTHWIFDLKKV
jgi:hypothetical protein